MSEATPSDSLQDTIRDWLDSLGQPCRGLQSLAGDVSNRRYFRVSTTENESVVAAYYPSDLLPACRAFTVTTDLLSRAEIRTPMVLAVDYDRGLMLLEDVGDETLYDHRKESWGRLSGWLLVAGGIVRRIQEIPRDLVAGLNPALEARLLKRELEQTWTLFLEPNDLVGDLRCATRLHNELDRLCDALAAEALVVCHRDFMARNLVPVRNDRSLIVLDHQDLRLGPRHYDLASLLNDSIFAPPDIEQRLVRDFAHTAEDRISYHRAAVQRTLKAVGTFELFSRRGFQRHSSLIPTTLARALAHLERLEEFSDLVPEIRDAWQSISVGPGGTYHKKR
ncbi:MAG: phosphotransferase [Acidobacteriota bacterium]